jgi:hypothetical protein
MRLSLRQEENEFLLILIFLNVDAIYSSTNLATYETGDKVFLDVHALLLSSIVLRYVPERG